MNTLNRLDPLAKAKASITAQVKAASEELREVAIQKYMAKPKLCYEMLTGSEYSENRTERELSLYNIANEMKVRSQKKMAGYNHNVHMTALNAIEGERRLAAL